MYKNVLEKMRQCIHQRLYLTRTHAVKALDDDYLAPDDAIRAIFNG